MDTVKAMVGRQQKIWLRPRKFFFELSSSIYATCFPYRGHQVDIRAKAEIQKFLLERIHDWSVMMTLFLEWCSRIENVMKQA
jgi:hypothetical protein